MKTIPTLLFSLLIATPIAKADVTAMMKDLVQMRAELESLNREMDSLQKEKQAELELWTSKKLELEASMQKETLRKLQLEEKTIRLAARVKSESKANPEAKKQFITWLEQANDWVETSLPYRKEQRKEHLANLHERANRGMESLESLSAELWMFYETEFKMASDNEFRIVDVTTDKGSEKAEVARIGLFAMFFRTPDGKFRQSAFEGDKWVTKAIETNKESDVVRLINNMKSKKDSGMYQLPIAASRGVM